MRKRYSLAIALLLTMFCNVSSGQTFMWTGKQTLERVYKSINGSITVRTDPPGAHINPHGCSSKSNYQLYVGESNEYQDRYKMLLTALASGNKISFSLSGCAGAYPAIHSVIVYKD